ncbi:MAG: hypothetical protein HW412_1868, partial [Bacteroidetes bacterium]|nr:hypothetical protein [Bacteroidota bacterium]
MNRQINFSWASGLVLLGSALCLLIVLPLELFGQQTDHL